MRRDAIRSVTAMSRAKMTSKRHIAVHAVREYAGESLAKPLIDFLNSPRPRKKKARIERLLEAASELTDRLAAEFKRMERTRLPNIAKAAAAMDSCAEINSILAQYRLTPTLFPSERTRWGLDGWEIIWDSPYKGRVHGVNTREALALQRLLELAREGWLPKVRRCRNVNCNFWFYARFEHQRYHSTPCQTSDPEWKKQRSDYMKKLRQLHKRR
jgi:hypothetical protein